VIHAKNAYFLQDTAVQLAKKFFLIFLFSRQVFDVLVYIVCKERSESSAHQQRSSSSQSDQPAPPRGRPEGMRERQSSQAAQPPTAKPRKGLTVGKYHQRTGSYGILPR
jgi:hypothetical protein